MIDILCKCEQMHEMMFDQKFAYSLLVFTAKAFISYHLWYKYVSIKLMIHLSCYANIGGSIDVRLIRTWYREACQKYYSIYRRIDIIPDEEIIAFITNKQGVDMWKISTSEGG